MATSGSVQYLSLIPYQKSEFCTGQHLLSFDKVSYQLSLVLGDMKCNGDLKGKSQC